MTNAKTKVPTTAEEWREIGRTGAVARTMNMISQQVSDVLDGNQLACLIFGGAGMGKNHVVDRELTRRGLGDTPEISPRNKNDLLAEFHKATFDIETHRRRAQPHPMIFNEARLILETAPNLDVMKVATDLGEHAKYWDSGYIWWSEGEWYEGKGGEMKRRRVKEKGTSLRAPIIALTNMNLHEFPQAIRESAEALSGRAPPIEITGNRVELWEYVVHLALTTDILTFWKAPKNPNADADAPRKVVRLSLAMRCQILDYFTENLMRLKWPSIRGLENIRNTFAKISDPILLEDTLALMLNPPAKWEKDLPPRVQDWGALRAELEVKLPKAEPKPRKPKPVNAIDRVAAMVANLDALLKEDSEDGE